MAVFLGFRTGLKHKELRKVNYSPLVFYMCLFYLACLTQQSTSPSPIIDTFYGIKWAHDVAGCPSPTDNQLVRNILEGFKRILSNPFQRKNPLQLIFYRKCI